MAGLTLDSGALIAYERQQGSSWERVEVALELAAERDELVTIPTVVVAEVWRGGPRAARVARLLKSSQIEVLSQELAREAGLLRGQVTPVPSAVDAIVVASAERRGDVVVTDDPGDIGKLAALHERVSVLPI